MPGTFRRGWKSIAGTNVDRRFVGSFCISDFPRTVCANKQPESPGPYVLVTLLNVGGYYRSLLSRQMTIIDTTVSNYRIFGKLGGGDMAVVYKAEDTWLHREKSRVGQT